jgi:hypothetical protein
MVMGDENPDWVGSQIPDNRVEMMAVFYRTGVDNEPTLGCIDDIGIRTIIGHLSGIVRDNPLDALGDLYALRAGRFRLCEKHAALCH